MSVFVPANKGHRKGASGRRFCMYSIYDNRTDFPIVIDATAEECARVLKGKNKRYAVLRRFIDEEDMA